MKSENSKSSLEEWIEQQFFDEVDIVIKVKEDADSVFHLLSDDFKNTLKIYRDKLSEIEQIKPKKIS